ncbi:MAG: hypothetical protein IPK68_01400 [Bdellovibrionales bacterium]|nr:hypothetical protein [Bdellovibrionales bacterium]
MKNWVGELAKENGGTCMYLRRLLVLMVIFSVSSGSFAHSSDIPSVDEDFGCSLKEKFDQYIHDFSVDIDSFGGPELCNSKVDTKKLINDFEIVERGLFAPGNSNVFIQNLISADSYYQWLSSVTYGVRRGSDLPWATAYNSGGYFTMQDGWAKLSTLGRVGTLLHEARHTEGYSHRSCSHGPYSNTRVPGCDESISEGGAHAVEMEYYSRVVLQGENFHPLYKSMARLMTLGRANFVFNENPMKEEHRLLARSGNSAFVVSAEGHARSDIPVLQGYSLKSTSFGASLFNGSDAFAIDFYKGNQGSTSLLDDFSYFKITRMPQHVPTIDLEEVDLGDRRFLIGLTANEQMRSFLFSNATWSPPVKIPGAVKFARIAPDGSQGLFVIKGGGRYCQVDLKTLNCPDSHSLWPEEIIQYAISGDELVELNREKKVLHSSTHTSYPPLMNQPIDDIVSVRLFDSFALSSETL